MSKKKSSGIVGIILLFIIIAGDILTGIGASRVPGLTRTVADTLYCSITSANCSSLYCQDPILVNANCSYCYPGGSSLNNPCPTFNPYLTVKRTTTFTTSSTSFVTVTSGAGWQNNGLTIGITAALCTATFNFNANSLAGNVQFQIKDITSTGVSNPYQEDLAALAVISSNTMGSITATFSTLTVSDIIGLQAKVSVGTITLNVIKSDILCMSPDGTAM